MKKRTAPGQSLAGEGNVEEGIRGFIAPGKKHTLIDRGRRRGGADSFDDLRMGMAKGCGRVGGVEHPPAIVEFKPDTLTAHHARLLTSGKRG